LLVVNSKARLTASQCLAHPWLQNTSRKLAEQLRIDMSLAETLKKDKEEKSAALATDDANKNKAATGIEHKFSSMTYTSPHYCGVCGKFLWGYFSRSYLLSLILFILLS